MGSVRRLQLNEKRFLVSDVTRKLYLVNHTMAASFCVLSGVIVPTAERLLNMLKSMLSDCGTCTCSGDLRESTFLVPAFSGVFEGVLCFLRAVSLEELMESVKERSAFADEPKVNQYKTKQSQNTVSR